MEQLSAADALEAIRFAEVVVLLMDAERLFEEQDLRIADLVEREGRALVIGINKWDLKEREGGSIGRLRAEAERRLQQVKGVPVVAVSGLTGEGLDRLMQAVVDIHAVWNKRVATNPLNRWLEGALQAHPPPAVSGRRLKLNYITQPKARPPSFVLFCTRADAVPDVLPALPSPMACARRSTCRACRSASRCAKRRTRSRGGRRSGKTQAACARPSRNILLVRGADLRP